MCDARDINGCEKQGRIALKDKKGWPVKYRGIEQQFCSEECANEYAREVSEGTWCPFPEALNAITQDQIEENLSYFRE